MPAQVEGDAQEIPAGIGLPVIRALVHRVRFSDAAEHGTEVRMEFATKASRSFKPLEASSIGLLPLTRAELAATMSIAIAPARLARTVLPRVLSVLAARANFSTDRISDAQLVADAIVAQADGSRSGDLTLAVTVKPRSLELQLGPLGVGLAQGLIADSDIAGLGQLIQKLTDHHQIASLGASEVLTLGLVDRR
jgi:hypothetical protein